MPPEPFPLSGAARPSRESIACSAMHDVGFLPDAPNSHECLLLALRQEAKHFVVIFPEIPASAPAAIGGASFSGPHVPPPSVPREEVRNERRFGQRINSFLRLARNIPELVAVNRTFGGILAAFHFRRIVHCQTREVSVRMSHILQAPHVVSPVALIVPTSSFT